MALSFEFGAAVWSYCAAHSYVFLVITDKSGILRDYEKIQA